MSLRMETGLSASILDEAREIVDSLDLPELPDGESELLRYGDGSGSEDSGVVETRLVTDTRIASRDLLITPAMLEDAVPLTAESAATTLRARDELGSILRGEDDRLAVMAGPCSIHDLEAALEYAEFIREMKEQYGEDLLIFMRDYLEKPRSVLGWKGMVLDPELDGSHNTNLGLVASRILLMRVTGIGVAAGMERLDTSTPQYFNGLIAYDAIGARNAADQNARSYASGTSSPVGIKNSPDGSISVAVDGVESASSPHYFIGIDRNGRLMRVRTTGNEQAHVILRGSDSGPNYGPEYVDATVEMIRARNDKGAELLEAVAVDTSHGNSGKDHTKQIEVVTSIAGQIGAGQRALKLAMIESNLREGRQKHTPGQTEPLEYGVSITDACVDLNETAKMFDMFANGVRERRQRAA